MKQQVFERVRAAGQIARVDIARALGVSPATVTHLTSELMEDGYLLEQTLTRDTRDSARGRPPVALTVKRDAALVAGIKCSDVDFTAVIVDFGGQVIASGSAGVAGDPHSLSGLLDICENLLKRVTRGAGLAIEDLATIGLGVPGFVDSETGTVYWSSVLDSRTVRLAAAAEERFQRPVVIENDANLVTLAELWFGVGREISDFAVVTIEHGVGMGIVAHHRLFRGGRGLGMELGHIKMQLDGALCRCGQRGCLEAYVADYALAREATTALNWNPEQWRTTPVLLERLYNEAGSGNAAARTIFDRAGRYLTAGLANVANLFDPSLIILSGERMRFDYLYADDALAEMANLTLNTGRPLPPIQVHRWGDLLWAQGAAALALSHVCEERFA